MMYRKLPPPTLHPAMLALLLITFTASQTVTASAVTDLTQAEAHLRRARDFRSSNDPRAEAEYKKAITSRDGNYPVAWLELSFVLARELRFDEASKALSTYLKQSPQSRTTSVSNRVKQLKRAAKLKQRHDRNEKLSLEESLELVTLIKQAAGPGSATPIAEKAVSVYSSSSHALVTLSELISTDEPDRAEQLLNQAVSLNSDEAFVYSKRGWFYLWTRHSPGEAESDFRKAIDLSDGNDSRAWHGLGEILETNGRIDEAIDAYRRYLRTRPKFAEHYDPVIKRRINDLQQRNVPFQTTRN